jgi:hypothetical protein
LAAIGIPSIIGAYNTAQEKTKARNCADVEKAKGVITLPATMNMAGAIGASGTNNQALSASDIAGICAAMKFANEEALREALLVNGTSISLGDWTAKATY